MTDLNSITKREHVNRTSYSGITLHRSCPQAWSYKTIFGLSRPPSDDPKVEARFGTIWHALRAAEAIERGRRVGSIKYVPRSIRVADGGPKVMTRQHKEMACTRTDSDPDTCKNDEHFEPVLNLQERVFAAVEAWEEQMPEEHADLWKEKLGTRSPSLLLRSLDARYLVAHAADIENEHPIGVEVYWERILPGDSGATLLGYTDEVYLDVKRHLIVVRDHKTAKQLSIMNAADDMLNSQLHLNAWGLSDRIKEWGCQPVGAISYERVNSVMPPKPKLVKSGRLSATVKNFDLETYLTFCESPEAKEAGYEREDAVVQRITEPQYISRWFQRTLTPVNRNIATAHLQAAVDTEVDSRKTVETVKRRGAGPRNMTGNACRYCDFAKLCRAQMIGGADGEYEIEEYGLRVKEKKERTPTRTPSREAAVLAEVSA